MTALMKYLLAERREDRADREAEAIRRDEQQARRDEQQARRDEQHRADVMQIMSVALSACAGERATIAGASDRSY
jgi:hypothetical protein